jgi:nitrate/nitrite transporter NarK
MLFLFIIRRLNPRRRAIVGAVITVIGLALIGVAATVASVLMIHGIITTTVGIAFCIAAYHGHRKAQAAEAIPAPAGDRPLVTR